MADKSILFVCRQSPYGSSLARAGLDAALAAAAFEQPVNLLFLGTGVLQLDADQDGRAIGQRDQGKLLASFPLYDIDQVYADADAIKRHGLDTANCALPVIALGGAEMQQLLTQSDHVLGF